MGTIPLWTGQARGSSTEQTQVKHGKSTGQLWGKHGQADADADVLLDFMSKDMVLLEFVQEHLVLANIATI